MSKRREGDEERRKLGVLYVRISGGNPYSPAPGLELVTILIGYVMMLAISANWPRTEFREDRHSCPRPAKSGIVSDARPGQNQQFALSISFVPWPTKKNGSTSLLTTPPGRGESRWNLGFHVSRMGRACSFSFPRQTANSKTLDKQNGEQTGGNVEGTALHRFRETFRVSLGSDAFSFSVLFWHSPRPTTFDRSNGQIQLT